MVSFSFIVPVYNCANTIENCVKSILEAVRLHSSECEIILVDDGATDGSAACCDRLAEASNSIVVIHQCNKGVSAARNAGLRAAKGKYIVFLDADDTISPMPMSECMKAVVENEQIDLLIYGISFDYYKRDKCYRSEVILPPFDGIRTKTECMDAINVLFNRNCLSALWNKIIRRELIVDIQFREDMFILEDLEFSVRVLARSEIVFFVEQPVYHYVQGGNVQSRMRRITDISEVTSKIENALSLLPCEKRGIISSVENTLRRGKLDSMTIKEVLGQYPGEAKSILLHRYYSKLRHGVAETIKMIVGDFRKW